MKIPRDKIVHARPIRTDSPGRQASPGFTIIELLIVLALVSVIMLVVFFAVPSAQRTQRNNQFRQFAKQTAAQLETYYTQHNLANPATPAEVCDFVTNYMQDINRGMDTCSPTIVGGKQCVLVTGGRYTICYHEASSPHSYAPPEDELSIQLSHKCATSGTDPIASTATTGDGDLRRYVIWHKTEGGSYCIDNSGE